LEFQQWVKYRNKRGSLNTPLRLEMSIAQLCALTANLHSKEGGWTVYDFSPHSDKPALSLEEAMRTWN
jgi:hypothetical protein